MRQISRLTLETCDWILVTFDLDLDLDLESYYSILTCHAANYVKVSPMCSPRDKVVVNASVTG